MSKNPSSGNFDDNMGQFLAQSRMVIKQYRGINESSLTMIAGLAAQKGISREEMEAGGSILGLSEEGIQQIVRDAGLKREGGNSFSLVGIMATAAVAIFVLAGVGILVVNLNFQSDSGNPSKDSETVAETKSKSDPTTPVIPDVNPIPVETNNEPDGDPISSSPTSFVKSRELLQAVKRMQAQFPGQKATLELLKSDNKLQRQEAWRKLLPKLRSFFPIDPLFDPTKQLLASYYSLEDFDENADLIRQGLVKLLPPHIAKVPEDPKDYEFSYWALKICVLSLKHPKLSPVRKTKMVQSVKTALGIDDLNLDHSTEELENLCGTALTKHYYSGLNAVVEKKEEKAAQLHDHLYPWAKTYLDPGSLQDYRNEFLAGLSKKTEVVKKDPGGEKPTPEPKKKLDPHLLRLKSLAHPLLRKPMPKRGDIRAQLQATIDLVKTATLACAYAQGEAVYFEKLSNNSVKLEDYLPEIPKKPANPQPPAENPALPPQGFQNFPGGNAGFPNPNPVKGFPAPQNLPGYQPQNPFNPPGQGQAPIKVDPKLSDKEITASAIRHLVAGRTSEQRYKALMYVAKQSQQPELHTQQAEAIVSYLFAINNEPEFQAAMSLLGDLSRFRSLSLAFADTLKEKNPSSNRVGRILSSYFQKEIKLEMGPNWKQGCRALLLKHALSSRKSLPIGGAGEALYAQLYKAQIQLILGKTMGEKTTKPSQVLEVLVQNVAKQLKAADLPPKDEDYLDKLPDRFLVSDYLTSNDLEKTVLLNQIWLKLLAIQVSQMDSQKPKICNFLCQDLERELSQQEDLLQQLYLTERQILHMWMLALDQPLMTAKK